MASNNRSAVNRGKFALFMVYAGLVFGLDQWTKYFFAHAFEWGQVSPVFPGFNLVLAINRGAAFSFLSQAGGWQRWLFSLIAIAVIVVLLRLLWRHSTYTLFGLSLASIISGALGNLVDRMMRGYVIDFLDFYWNGYHWPAFNVADIAICAGAVLLILDEVLGLRNRRK